MSNFPDKRLTKILSDKTSGSTELLLKLNGYFSEISDQMRLLNRSVKLAEKKLSHFAVVQNYLKDLSKVLERQEPEAVRNFSKNYKQEQREKYNRLYSNAVPHLLKFKTFITLSNSRTLIEVFSRLKKDKHKFKVIVAESRPKLEGRLFAKALLRKGIKVELITDAEVSLFVPRSDAFVLGADIVLSSGNIVNKTGSKAIALLCRFHKKPVIALTSKEKISGKKLFRPAKMKSGEVWTFSHENLKTTNIYFEEIESILISKLITD